MVSYERVGGKERAIMSHQTTEMSEELQRCRPLTEPQLRSSWAVGVSVLRMRLVLMLHESHHTWHVLVLALGHIECEAWLGRGMEFSDGTGKSVRKFLQKQNEQDSNIAEKEEHQSNGEGDCRVKWCAFI